MRHQFRNKEITGILSILPEREFLFDDEISNYTFPEKQTRKLKAIMGYDRHRLVKADTAVSDLCVFGMNVLFERGALKKEEIGALILITQSPDYFMPPTSNVIQGRLGLDSHVLCMDINQGCCGYLMGLMQAFLLLDLDGVHKVALLNADILSKKVSKQDRNSYPLSGDAAAITIVEHSSEDRETLIPFCMSMDGSRGELLMIPAGGFRRPSDAETGRLRDAGDGNLRGADHLVMDGSEVFRFVQREVPPMIEELLRVSHVKKEEIDYYFFHQPNRFMLERLAAALGIPKEKLPMNIVELYGNSSGCTIPVNLVHNLGKQLEDRSYYCCLAGFGSGLSWGAMLLHMGNMKFAESIIAPY